MSTEYVTVEELPHIDSENIAKIASLAPMMAYMGVHQMIYDLSLCLQNDKLGDQSPNEIMADLEKLNVRANELIQEAIK